MRPIRVDGRIDAEFLAIQKEFTEHARVALERAIAAGFDSMQASYVLQGDVWCEEFLQRKDL